MRLLRSRAHVLSAAVLVALLASACGGDDELDPSEVAEVLDEAVSVEADVRCDEILTVEEASAILGVDLVAAEPEERAGTRQCEFQEADFVEPGPDDPPANPRVMTLGTRNSANITAEPSDGETAVDGPGDATFSRGDREFRTVIGQSEIHVFVVDDKVDGDVPSLSIELLEAAAANVG